MIFKEEKILPNGFGNSYEDEWIEISRASNEIGYCLITPGGEWKLPGRCCGKIQKEGIQPSENKGYVEFDAGCLTPEEICHAQYPAHRYYFC